MDEATRHLQAVDAVDHGNIKSHDICHPNAQRVYLSTHLLATVTGSSSKH